MNNQIDTKLTELLLKIDASSLSDETKDAIYRQISGALKEGVVRIISRHVTLDEAKKALGSIDNDRNPEPFLTAIAKAFGSHSFFPELEEMANHIISIAENTLSSKNLIV